MGFFVKRVFLFLLLGFILLGGNDSFKNKACAVGEKESFVIYGLYRGLSMNDDEPADKDYYVNMGTRHGVGPGAQLEVLHPIHTLDPFNERMQTELLFPIADLRVIQAASTVSVARLLKMRSSKNTPIFTPRGIMLGDLVRPIRSLTSMQSSQ